ncbi:hypothetical protein [Planosporangium flavigriseum]|uniref:Uncharacterized protein n=2 Tax=Planosporangium flavigriseum TaxID=373681 RepID=A0A8J3LPZ1_9ACTN|nr:hypothetical protein [Planosporangium flavigriseum]GIG74518.1 hypothetical protein Pfl04_29220 [Planosporangium flavigriseum]
MSDALKSRVENARRLAAALATLVGGEGREGAVWYRRLRDIETVLGDIGRPARDLLRDAAEMLDSLYEGPRNFSDFHIYRDDPAARFDANEELSTLVSELTAALSTER